MNAKNELAKTSALCGLVLACIGIVGAIMTCSPWARACCWIGLAALVVGELVMGKEG